MADFSKEIADLEGIAAIAVDVGQRLTNENAPVGAVKSIGATEIWIIQETATRLAADLASPGLLAPPIPGPVPFEGEKPFVLAEEQKKLWQNGDESGGKGFNMEAEREKLKAGGKVL